MDRHFGVAFSVSLDPKTISTVSSSWLDGGVTMVRTRALPDSFGWPFGDTSEVDPARLQQKHFFKFGAPVSPSQSGP